MFEYVKKHALFLAVLILSVIYFSSFIFKPAEEKSLESAFLNPKYEISRIRFSTSGEVPFEIFISGKFSYGKTTDPYGKEVYFPVSQKLVSELLEKSRKIRKMYEISYKKDSWKAFSLEKNDCFHMEFLSPSKETPCSSLDFGAINVSQSRIFFKTENRDTVFQTDSEIAGFLTCSPDFWSCETLLPESITGKLDSSTVSELDFTSNFQQKIHKTLKSGEEFDVAADKISSFRHSSIMLSVQESEIEGEPLMAVSITEGTGKKFRLDFYPLKDSEEDSYFVIFRCSKDGFFSSEQKAFLDEYDPLSYGMKISRWTFLQIQSLFN